MDLEVVKKINQSPYKAFFAIAGGGQSFIGDYTKISGASETVVGAIIPYHQSTFDTFVGEKVEKYCSDETARKLATACYKECIKAGQPAKFCVGIGASSSVVKDNEREGREHHFFIAAHCYNKTFTFNLTLRQGRTRLREDQIANDLIMVALTRATVNPDANLELVLGSKEKLQYDIATAPNTLSCLYPCNFTGNLPDHLVIYPGSFNPFHKGHKLVYSVAEKILDAKPILEFSTVNTDKIVPDWITVRNRVAHLDLVGLPYLLTDKPTFKEKVKFFRDRYPDKRLTFVVGADVWERIWNVKYAGPLNELEDFFWENNVKFLVFARRGSETKLNFGEDLKITCPMAEKIELNISSTQIRKREKNKQNEKART